MPTTLLLFLLNLSSSASALLRVSSLSSYSYSNVDAALGRPKGSLPQTLRRQLILTNSKGGTRNFPCLFFHGSGPKPQSRSPNTNTNQIQNDQFANSIYNNVARDYDNDGYNNEHKNTDVGKECDHDFLKIRKGEIYVQENFLNPAQVALLRNDIAQLQEQMQQYSTESTTTESGPKTFTPSGLSNRVAGDRNKFGSSDRLTCTITQDLFQGEKALSRMRHVVEGKMEGLKLQLQAALSSERSLKLELAEMYYSISSRGSHLPRHQDERHEETKGNKAWINDTRRSISWLIYLNEDGWQGTKTSTRNTSVEFQDDVHEKGHDSADQGLKRVGYGGELRAYVRKCCAKQGMQCGSHDGNIQVGWLRIESSPLSSSSSSSRARDRIEYEPIFLDCWVKTRVVQSKQEEGGEYYNDSFEWQAMSALYRIRTERASLDTKDECNSNSHLHLLQHDVREYLSLPFGPNSPSWPLDANLEPTDFASALALQFTKHDHKRRFVGVEDVTSECEIVDVLPTGGTLVLFDSVAIPHKVLEVLEGNRLAIAGWYHEKQQDFPEWYGT